MPLMGAASVLLLSSDLLREVLLDCGVHRIFLDFAPWAACVLKTRRPRRKDTTLGL